MVPGKIFMRLPAIMKLLPDIELKLRGPKRRGRKSRREKRKSKNKLAGRSHFPALPGKTLY